MNGYVLVCSSEWMFYGSPTTQEKYPYCSGTLQNVPHTALNPTGLSLEDWREYTWDVVGLFAMVFGFLAIKKALTQ